MKCPATRPAWGFTLIEVMITVAIIGILAAVAYPSYASYVLKGKRAAAQAALMDLASKQQTYLLDRRTYFGAADEDGLKAIGFAKPTELRNDYTFTCVPADCAATAFVARATPSAALQAKGEQPLTIDHTGNKTPANTTGYWGK